MLRLFENSAITSVERYPEGGPAPAGTAMIVNFTLDGRDDMALNGGPEFKFNEAFSIFVSCGDQAEVDGLWDKLTADGGEPGHCGWLKDRWGFVLQIIPTALPAAGGPDRERSGRAMQAMFKMQKIDIKTLENA